MSLPQGKHELGPHNGTLAIRTSRSGAASKAGHDLLIHVTSWKGELELAGDPAATSANLTADATSLQVIEGTGGVKDLGEDDKGKIQKTIDERVLRRKDISFTSTGVSGDSDSGALAIEGDLTLAAQTKPIRFELTVAEDKAISATALVTQTAWGMKPYSALLGALKVADEVEVSLEGRL